jgi:hypothetical protein
MSPAAATCCPPFDPQAWDRRELDWQDKLFVQTRVRSFLHIPVNFGPVIRKATALIEAAQATVDPPLVLADENSLWGADVYVAVAREVPGAKMARLSGHFLCRVFDGPYSQIPRWIREMQSYVASEGRTPQQLYFYYTTCPKCAKLYGHNYVVLLASV